MVSLRKKYPQGGEKQLIDAVTGRRVPSMGLPIDAGVVVQNVGTSFAVYEAVQKNKPLFEGVMTVTGECLDTQHNFLLRVGTPFEKILEAVGGVPQKTAKIISGGPMMGKRSRPSAWRRVSVSAAASACRPVRWDWSLICSTSSPVQAVWRIWSTIKSTTASSADAVCSPARPTSPCWTTSGPRRPMSCASCGAVQRSN